MILDVKKERKSNFELLRILAIVLIILHHFSVHSNFVYDTSILTFNHLFIQCIYFGGKVGVDCFVLISGYFLIKQRFRLKRIVRLLCEIWFYSAVIVLFCKVTNLTDVSWTFLIYSLVPVYPVNWFAYSYFVLYLLSPFINNWIMNTNRSTLIRALFVMTAMWCGIFFFFSEADMGRSLLGWFVYLYCIGAFIQLYVHKKISLQYIGFFIIFVVFLMFSTIMIIDLLGVYVPWITVLIGEINNYAMHFCDLYSIFIVCISVSLFLFFKTIKIKPNRYINSLAKTMFGVYLIHDNPLVRHMIWLEWFKKVLCQMLGQLNNSSSRGALF